MSLRHILLGLLDQPQSGYDLKQVFEQVFRHFWSAELAQIYPTLRRLEEDGLSRSKQVPSDKGPDKKLYKRTAQGTRELKRWLESGPTAGKDRLHYLAQVFFLDAASRDQRLRFFKDLRSHFVAELEELRAVERGWSAEDPHYPDALPDEAFYKQLTLRLGLKKVAAIVDWCEECIAVIEKRE